MVGQGVLLRGRTHSLSKLDLLEVTVGLFFVRGTRVSVFVITMFLKGLSIVSGKRFWF